MKIFNRSVVVTGAGSGIGRAVAQALAERGSTIILVDRDSVAIDEVIASLSGTGHMTAPLDVTEPNALRALFEQLAASHRDLAGVVNAAGIVTGGEPWPDSDLSKMLAVLSINAGGTATTTTLAATYPIPGDRAVINISSHAALRPLPQDPMYAMSKAGVLAFTRSAAMSDNAIRVNALLPGVVRTPMLATTGSDGVAAWLAPRMSRPLLTAEHIADAVVELIIGDYNGIAWSIDIDPDDSTASQIVAV